MKNKQKEWHSAFKPLKNNLSGFPSDCQPKYLIFCLPSPASVFSFVFSSKMFIVYSNETKQSFEWKQQKKASWSLQSTEGLRENSA
jgi:hypothetical protein